MKAQPKLEWTRKAWTRKSEEFCHVTSGEDHEHWYAHLGEYVAEDERGRRANERYGARLRYCPEFEDLWLMDGREAEEVPLVELYTETEGDLATKLAACEQLCIKYMHSAFGKLVKVDAK